MAITQCSCEETSGKMSFLRNESKTTRKRVTRSANGNLANLGIMQVSRPIKRRNHELADNQLFPGYHCSWCYNPEGIRTKLMSAQKHDKPRWGDYPEKTNVTYIAKLIKTGGWFDDKHPFIKVTDTSQKFYAPQYILDNPDRFNYLLKPP